MWHCCGWQCHMVHKTRAALKVQGYRQVSHMRSVWGSGMCKKGKEWVEMGPKEWRHSWGQTWMNAHLGTVITGNSKLHSIRAFSNPENRECNAQDVVEQPRETSWAEQHWWGIVRALMQLIWTSSKLGTHCRWSSIYSGVQLCYLASCSPAGACSYAWWVGCWFMREGLRAPFCQQTYLKSCMVVQGVTW